jgi:flagellar M-ring protein FliF
VGQLRKVTDFWGGLAGPSRRLIIGAAVIFVVGLVLLMRLSGSTDYTTLVSGASTQDASAITKELEAAGIPFRTRDGGQTVQVPSGQLDQARLDLASSNLLEGGGNNVGWDIFDKQGFGATDFTQRINFVRAMEGELSRTIAKLDQVQTATVRIAMPQQRLFTSEDKPTTASVLLALRPGATLDPDQVNGVTRLVAMAVPGLDVKNVTVTDTQGNILQGSDGDNGAATAANTRMAIEASYERSTQARLDAMLAGILGPGKAVTQVDAVLNLDRTTSEAETYDPESAVVIAEDSSRETLRSRNGGSGAAAGATANTPGNTFPATTGGNGDTNYTKNQNKTQRGVNRTRTSTERVPGTIESQSISVQISDDVPAATVGQIQDAVEKAVGFEQERDQISVQRVAFADGALASEAAEAAEAAEESAGPAPALNIMNIAKTGGAAIGVLLILLMARRALRRRQSELERALPELLQRGPVPVAALTAGDDHPRLEGQTKSPIERQMEDLAMRAPDDMAKLVRAWIAQR